MSTTLDIDVLLNRGAFSLEVAFAAGPGLTALFGRSGSGKTTVIDLIAGLARPDRGRIAVTGETLLDTERGIAVPVHRRRIGVVFQQARLMPHLSVRRNLGYGRAFARGRSDGIAFEGVVDLLGLGHLLERRPAGLSGGEAQRVAIGRALLSRPRLLLMDEPLAALDEGRKAEILPYIERLRDEAGLPIVYVSHAVSEVARLARTVVVLEAGRVAAVGAADTVLRQADLLATQEAEAGAILDMIVEETDSETGLTRLSGRVGRLWVPRLLRSIGTAVRIRVPARDVLLATQAPVGLSARNILEGHVVSIHAFGEAAAMVQIDCHGVLLAARLTRASVRDLALAPGRAVYAVVKSIAFDPQGVGTAGPAPVEI
ncbi:MULTISPECIES: molybdenum ABC transporter ATP-binding protein [unclassified Methylobacterium]|uniref:molybdenum ABC transporter ATP-binding protein n=1 Tax=unclassified Methylobacterium TaxID=2615210 RepID=UPI0006FD53F6|nr:MULTISPECIES: molybdenum ABC transporter ATP-binding protein [unclassified Methylobacterium]KQO50046.1 molybdenum ABC transporter ATP-binding protein [Methylobacterium sp. Leaf86]KQO84838.1 molybdenum ABC transporter ATP-binding protein [Methylobacterium sp. Leaf91]